MEKSEILKRIIEEAGQNFNLDNILDIVCKELSELFDVDRVAIARYGKNDEWTALHEYRVDASIPPLANVSISKEVMNYLNHELLDKNHDMVKNNLQQEDVPQYYKELHYLLETKSIINVPIKKDNENWGVLGIMTNKSYRLWSEEDISFLHEVVNYIYLLIKLSELFTVNKIQSERENVLRDAISSVRSTLDINEIKNKFVNIIGKYFKADRVIFSEYDREREFFLPTDVHSEYLINSSIPSFIGFKWNDEQSKPYINLLKKEKEINFSSLQEYIESKGLKNTDFNKLFESWRIKSSYNILVTFGKDVMGFFCIDFIEHEYSIDAQDLEFLKTFASQMGIALYQIHLLESLKYISERESVLRKTVEILRSTFDSEKIKTFFVEITANYFDADRCLFDEFNKQTKQFSPFKLEKLKSSDIESIAGIDVEKNFPEFVCKLKKKKDIINKDLEKVYPIERLAGYKSLETSRRLGLKSDYGFSVIYKENHYGVLIIHYVNKKRILSREELVFLNILRNQVGVALYQSELFKHEQESAARERILRDVSNKIRSSLDQEYVKKEIIEQLVHLFNADRVLISYFDQYSGKLVVSKETEYRANSDLIPISDVDLLKIPGFKSKIRDVHLSQKDIIFADLDNYLADNNFQGTDIEDFYRKFGFISSAAINIYYQDNFLGNIVIAYQHPRIFSDDEIKFLRSIADQAGIAIYQAELYSKLQELSKKEKILREVVSNINLSQNLEESYSYILNKLIEVFDADRAFFVSFDQFDPSTAVIKYEKVIDSTLKLLKESKFPDIFLDLFNNLIKEQKSFVVENINEYHPENLELHKFCDEFDVKSFMISPYIKGGKEQVSLGIFVICSNKINKFDKKSISLFEEILDSSVLLIWEIIKHNEIDELRNTFILTLAHDLQVPLVGERRALEFIMSIPPGQMLDNYKDIIAETIKNNEKMSSFLKKLVDSYTYELGRKKLHYIKINIIDFANNILQQVTGKFADKRIQLVTRYDEKVPLIYLDTDEISKVINILIDNAIEFSHVGGTIIVEIKSENNNIIISVIDVGQGISKEIQRRLFKRYEMAIVLERKIGSGLGLYLAKQIVEAHKGRIWYSTKEKIGTTFSFSLPINI